MLEFINQNGQINCFESLEKKLSVSVLAKVNATTFYLLTVDNDALYVSQRILDWWSCTNKERMTLYICLKFCVLFPE